MIYDYVYYGIIKFDMIISFYISTDEFHMVLGITSVV
jgi:hypothetical protein